MIMRTRFPRTAVLLGAGLVLLPSGAQSQLASASAAAMGTADNYTALARGFAAVALNPAGLGLPGSPGFSLSFLAPRLRSALSPVGLSDLKEYEDALIPDAQKEAWLQDIAGAGGETGQVGLRMTWLALNVGPVGFQLSSTVLARATLNEDAAELLLYGNAGRTGSPKDFDLQGAGLDASAFTTAGVSFAIPLDLELGAAPDQHFAVGATVTYTMGHGLLMGRDAGSLLRSDPVEIDLRFPMIQSDTSEFEPNHGSGVGLDVGVAWEGGPLSVGAAVQNVFNTFKWELDGMFYRPGEAFFNDTDSGSDFDARPASQAPASLRSEVEELTFAPRLVAGAAFRALPGLTLTAEVKQRFGEGIDIDPKSHLGVGFEFTGIPVLSLRGGFAKVTDGIRVGGGAGLDLGPVHLNAAGLLQQGDIGDGALAMFTLSFGGS